MATVIQSYAKLFLLKKGLCNLSGRRFLSKSSFLLQKPRLFESTFEVQDSLAEESVFTEDHVELRRNIRKFIDKEINPYVEEWEEKGSFPGHELFKKLGNAGYLGVNKPVEYGGMGLDFSYAMALHEEFGMVDCGGIPMAIGVQCDMCTPALVNFGSHELKQQFLAPNIAGDFIGCLGVSEVGAGSDVASITTTAVKQGDDYVINGGKMWTTNGDQADWMCLLANTGGNNPHLNKSLICVPMNTPGITKSPTLSKLGMRSSDTVQVFFDNVKVPQKYRIGEEGKGFIYQMNQFQDERLVAGVQVLGIVGRLIHETANYTYNRKAFGKPLLDNQVIHFRLAELETELEALRSLVYRAIGLYVKGHDVTKLASMAKLKGGRLAREVADSTLQYWGGMGYVDGLMSRTFRDVRLLSIGGGADEVMLGIISKYMDTLPKGK